MLLRLKYRWEFSFSGVVKMKMCDVLVSKPLMPHFGRRDIKNQYIMVVILGPVINIALEV